MTAATALTNAGIAVDEVRRRLPSVEPHLVWIVPASSVARRFWAKGIVGVTMPWAVYVTPAVFDRIVTGDRGDRYGPLVVHELVHLHQYRTSGAVRHLIRYAADYVGGRRRGLSHWDAYLGVGAEEQARRIASEFGSARGPG